MNDYGLYRLGLIFAILTAICWVLFIVGGMIIPPQGDLGPVKEYLATANSAGMILYNWGGILGSILAVPVFTAFFYGFRSGTGSALAVPVTLAIVGLAYMALGFMVDSGSLIYLFGPAVADAGGAEAARMVPVAQFAQDSIEVTWAFGSFLGYGGPILWMAILFIKAKQAPRWINIVGILAGAAGFIWLRLFFPFEVPGPISLIFIGLNVVFGMIWLIGLSGYLVRRAA